MQRNHLEALSLCPSGCNQSLLRAVQEAVKNCEYWRLIDHEGRPPGLMGWWPSKATTFIDNHDTGVSTECFSALPEMTNMNALCIARCSEHESSRTQMCQSSARSAETLGPSHVHGVPAVRIPSGGPDHTVERQTCTQLETHASDSPRSHCRAAV